MECLHQAPKPFAVRVVSLRAEMSWVAVDRALGPTAFRRFRGLQRRYVARPERRQCRWRRAVSSLEARWRWLPSAIISSGLSSVTSQPSPIAYGSSLPREPTCSSISPTTVGAANDGVTAIIDPGGRVFAPLPSFREGVVSGQFNYSSRITWFSIYGEWSWWLSIALTCGLLMLGLWRR